MPLRARCRDAAQRRSLEQLLRRLFVLGEYRAGPGVDLDLAGLDTTGPGGPPDAAERVYAADALTVHRSNAGYLLEAAGGWLVANVTEGRGRGALEGAFWRLDGHTHREFFLLALLMMLRRHGRYGLHANALVKDGRGVLLVGASGSGKTTLALGLMQAGWSLLSDDAVALRSAPAGVEAHAVRRGISCTERTERFYPALREAPTLYHARDKRVRDARTLFQSLPAHRCRPELIVFPSVGRRARSALEALSPVETLTGLARQSAGILTDGVLADREHSRRQLAVVARLAEQAPGLRLTLGRDAVENPAGVSALLTGAMVGHRG